MRSEQDLVPAFVSAGPAGPLRASNRIGMPHGVQRRRRSPGRNRAVRAARLAGALLLWGLAAQPAHARVTYPFDIPNGGTECGYCHTVEPDLNWFGADTLLTFESGKQAVVWERLAPLDSDGDGQTNGLELGDPCGVWIEDGTPWSEQVSDPSDSSSTLADPQSPDCPRDTAPPDDTGQDTQREQPAQDAHEQADDLECLVKE